jgi:lysozyme
VKINRAGLALIKKWEGYHRRLPDGRCQAYLDRLAAKRYHSPGYNGLWTIGYGCTENVYEGLIWTEKQAEQALRKELAKHERYMTDMIKVPVNSNQFSAMVSLCYNIGPGDIRRSTILRRLNAGDYEGTARAFAMYRMAGGKVYRGLVRRRADEARLFRTAPAEEVVKNSRKLTFWQRLRMLIPTGIGVGWLSWENLEQVRVFMTDYSGLLALAVGLIAWYVLHRSEKLAIQDYEDGRYVPSGLADAPLELAPAEELPVEKGLDNHGQDTVEAVTGRVDDDEFRAMLEKMIEAEVAERMADMEPAPKPKPKPKPKPRPRTRTRRTRK